MTVPVLTAAEIALFAADRRPRGRPPGVPDPALDGFRRLLKRYRDARRWSQERLAAESDMDHSLVSRLESGQRGPTRDAIGKIAAGLGLTPHARDDLLMAAGFLPDSIGGDELQEAVRFLRETTGAERAGALALIRAARRL